MESKNWVNIGEFRSKAEMKRVIDRYFADCDAAGELYSPAGLALALDLERKELHDVWAGKVCAPGREAISRAFLKIQHQIETHPAYMEKSMVRKAEFMLKQDWLGGYREKAEVSGDFSVNVTMGKGMDAEDFK